MSRRNVHSGFSPNLPKVAAMHSPEGAAMQMRFLNFGLWAASKDKGLALIQVLACSIFGAGERGFQAI